MTQEEIKRALHQMVDGLDASFKIGGPDCLPLVRITIGAKDGSGGIVLVCGAEAVPRADEED